MALQGNLREFAATEILQLVGMQQKTGCLILERESERVHIFAKDGRIVSTRLPGLAPNDSLLAFLRKIGRLSEEQHLGIATIQKESGRDFEDILLNGRYLDEEELAGYVERQILEDLTRIVSWGSGTYRFESDRSWDQPIHASLSVEGALIEAARRTDESRRSAHHFADPERLLVVLDLPDPDEPLSEEERELFGIIDGRHTLAEIVAAAPLTESETHEAIVRMLEARWIEFVGRRDPGPRAVPAHPVSQTTAAHAPTAATWLRNALVAGLVAVAALALFYAGHVLRSTVVPRADDVFLTAQLRDVRYALELFHRERGHYPARIEELATDRWVGERQLDVPGYVLHYHLNGSSQAYELSLEPTP
jgi:hypothetical protein